METANPPKAAPTDEELKKKLTTVQYQVTRCSATEPPFTGAYWNHKAKGEYSCICCATPLFSSEDKFDTCYRIGLGRCGRKRNSVKDVVIPSVILRSATAQSNLASRTNCLILTSRNVRECSYCNSNLRCILATVGVRTSYRIRLGLGWDERHPVLYVVIPAVGEGTRTAQRDGGSWTNGLIGSCRNIWKWVYSNCNKVRGVDDDQIDDRIDDALSFFYDYHYDGTEKLFMKHQITQTDIDRRWIYCPDAVLFVTGVLRFDDSNSSINMFDLRYQLRLHDLYDFTSVSYVSYEITMQHIQSLNLLFSGTPQFRFNRLQNKVFLDIDWTRDVEVGDYVIIECYRKMAPETVSLTGTAALTSGNTTVTGTGTKFDQEIVENDFVTFGSETIQVSKIISPTSITLTTAASATNAAATMTVSGLTDVWDNRFLKAYATAKIQSLMLKEKEPKLLMKILFKLLVHLNQQLQSLLIKVIRTVLK